MPQRFTNRTAVHANRSALGVRISKVSDQRLNVAVKDQTNQLQILVHNRRTRVAADDVTSRNKIHSRAARDFALGFHPALRQFEILLALVIFFMGKRAIDVGKRRDLLAIFFVADHRSKGQSQSKCSIWINRCAASFKHHFRNLSISLTLNLGQRFGFGTVLANFIINCPSQLNQRIR